ncbi:glyoxalase/bleomycin resistance/extradiol dioxygenase family protein [Phenylobacterium sp.]|uniref:VOC family protein n=1 Tax=Phenylobacterium sp. TaxID=1871053 RepID=UPI0027345EE6|nr:glyoxalase/bleomycin resistance/extradiol dioxygenase family protein [Phenylobacterium sp.]MDP3660941.1 glyoxalase/bleomycin resistance/extradiol dioxygenase family protein [Phenylobacterium sp.]
MADNPSSEQAMQAGGVIAHLSIDGAAKAMDFYKRAFGAEELMLMKSDDGRRVMHGHLKINGGDLMMADFFPDFGYPAVPAQGYALHLQVTDVDAWWKRAVDAGCEVTMPLAEQFWGDRYGQVKDPFGITWAMAAPK